MASTAGSRMLYGSLPLLGRNIRLLNILSTEPKIACKLTVAGLSPELRFNALSYVWGSPQETESITVNGLSLPITKNLAIALRSAHEHLQPIGTEPLPVWADAICINQTDHNEKSSQVPLMKDIYSMAEVVLCSLGCPQQTTIDAMECIKLISRQRTSKSADLEDTEVRLQLLNRNEALRNSIAAFCKLLEDLEDDQCTEERYLKWLSDLSPSEAVVETRQIAALFSKAEAQALRHEIQNFISYISSLLDDTRKIYPGSAKTVQLSQGQSLECSVYASQLQQGVNVIFGALSDSSREASDEYRRTSEAFTNDLCGKLNELQCLLLRLQQHASDKGRIPNLDWLKEHRSILRDMPENGLSRSGLSLIGEMMYQNYWNRVWTYQEIVLSRQPIFVCGSEQLDWRSLCSLIYWTEWIKDFGKDKRPEWISHEEWDLLTSKFPRNISRLFNAATARVRVRNLAWMEDTNNVPASEKIPEENIKFWPVSATLQATDPRDHYYGFLGINPINLTPDYTKTVGQVGIDFLFQHVMAHRKKSLEAQGAFSEFKPLDWAGIGHGWFMDPSTPSWVPNYPGIARANFDADERSGGPIMQVQNAVDDQIFQAWPKAVFKGSIIQVPAIIVEEITSIGPRRPQFCEGSEDNLEQAISWIIDSSMQRDCYIAGGHQLEMMYWALQHTTVRPLNLEGGMMYKDKSDDKSHLAWFLLSKLQERNDTGNDHCWSRRFEYLKTLVGKAKFPSEEYQEVITDMLGVCSMAENRLAETDSGYIGLFPKNLREGDMVCIVNGFRQPVLLRRVDEHYLFVGTCVVKGLQSEDEVGNILAGEELRPEIVEIW